MRKLWRTFLAGVAAVTAVGVAILMPAAPASDRKQGEKPT